MQFLKRNFHGQNAPLYYTVLASRETLKIADLKQYNVYLAYVLVYLNNVSFNEVCVDFFLRNIQKLTKSKFRILTF